MPARETMYQRVPVCRSMEFPMKNSLGNFDPVPPERVPVSSGLFEKINSSTGGDLIVGMVMDYVNCNNNWWYSYYLSFTPGIIAIMHIRSR
jgi:hypothetical protein